MRHNFSFIAAEAEEEESCEKLLFGVALLSVTNGLSEMTRVVFASPCESDPGGGCAVQKHLHEPL